MVFILFLIASTVAIAGAAAYFSVYGLAYTFSGVFWSVVAMGASLEAGKLIAASYLYRYWHKTNVILRSYLMFGVAALMSMTSVGIFGYLSSGYQQDVLPLKQKTEQVALLEEEKVRMLDRKRQIDGIMAGSTTVSTVEGAKGIDRNAVHALRETTRARESLVKQYKAEQKDVTQRVKELDVELLALKQELIKVEAHIGPITYIAKAFNLPTDDATKYLIFLIIFAFDPMAVALTLAVNTAMKVRREEQESAKFVDAYTLPTGPLVNLDPVPEVVSNVTAAEPLPEEFATVLHDNTWDLYERSDDLPPLEFDEGVEQDPITLEPVEEIIPDAPLTEVAPQSTLGQPRRTRPYPNLVAHGADMSQAKVTELVNHYQYLNTKVQAGEILSNDEQWELNAVKKVLSDAGYSQYL
jgi:hypothetical protein